MRSTWRLAAAGAVAGAIAGPLALAIVYASRPAVTLEMDRDPPGIVTGLYGVERAGSDTFAWTRRSVTVDLDGLDRRIPWRCVVRVRAGRGEPLTLPQASIAVDGRVVSTVQTTNDFQDVDVAVGSRGARGARLTLVSSDTFRPGPDDARDLGVQVDRLSCAPDDGAWYVLAPPRALAAAAIAAAGFGAALALTGAGAVGMVVAIGVIAVAQAFPLGWAFAPYSRFPARAAWLAVAAALALLVLVRGLELARRGPFSRAARAAAAISVIAAYLKLLALIHPSKLVVDAVFQAHRLEWILDGRFYFTQPMPSGVEFPYAIALYLFAAPWTLITSDYVSLLRVVVIGVEAIAAALLYPMVVRHWQDRLAGVLAVGLCHVVPLTYVVIGNANLPNAFGQAIALMALVAATLLPLGPGDRGPRVLLFAVAAVAMLSHVSTFALLVAILGSLGVLYRIAGGPGLRGPARALIGVTIAAALFAVVTYYGHFGEVYQRLDRVTAAGTGVAAAPSSTLPSRAAGAVGLTIDSIGWPILALAVLGLRSLRGRPSDRLTLAIGALGIAFVLFLVVGVVPRVEGPFERYAIEFVGRVVYATYPAAVILAGAGAAWAWRAGIAGRLISAGLLAAAAAIGTACWFDWLR